MAISVRNVQKRFGDFVALDDVSLEVPSGSLTALLGPSGSGKSTLLRVIAGLEKADTGEVFIGGSHATELPPHRRDVGFVFQHYAAFKHMTVAKNIAFGLEIRKRPKDDVKRRVAELLHLVQLDGFGDRYPSQLSGGQRQRMALARALAVEPEVLLLDEPFGALDARVRTELRAWLRRLHDEMHVTTVFVTHDQEEAMEVADTIVLMDRGAIVQEGAPQELYDDPRNEFVMRFMGHVNRIGDVYVRPHDVEIRLAPNGTTEPAVVERILHLGHHVRVELQVDGGEAVSAQLTRDEADRLELVPGRPVFVRPSRARTFDEGRMAEAIGASPA
jgi:sulfate transport system ATP-binding protein